MDVGRVLNGASMCCLIFWIENENILLLASFCLIIIAPFNQVSFPS
jgi:hypothetical protein